MDGDVSPSVLVQHFGLECYILSGFRWIAMEFVTHICPQIKALVTPFPFILRAPRDEVSTCPMLQDSSQTNVNLSCTRCRINGGKLNISMNRVKGGGLQLIFAAGLLKPWTVHQYYCIPADITELNALRKTFASNHELLMTSIVQATLL